MSKSLCCTLEINIILEINYTSLFKKKSRAYKLTLLGGRWLGSTLWGDGDKCWVLCLSHFLSSVGGFFTLELQGCYLTWKCRQLGSKTGFSRGYKKVWKVKISSLVLFILIWKIKDLFVTETAGKYQKW